MTEEKFALESKYEVRELLGDGGFGIVYKVWHRALKKYQAVKILKSEFLDSPSALERFEEEARTAIRIKHPNIASVLDLGTDDKSRPYISMPFIEGTRLSEVIQHGRLDLKIALQICLQLIDGLSYLHRMGVCHGDLSPENIIISHGPAGPKASIIDLGAAINTGEPQKLLAVGRLKNLSPERLTQNSVASYADDIFSAGIMFYQILAGKRPFHGSISSEDGSSVPSQLVQEPEPFEAVQEAWDIPQKLKLLVMRMLAKEASQRPSANELFEAWSKFLEVAPVDEICEASAVLRDDSSKKYRAAYIAALKESSIIDEQSEDILEHMERFAPGQNLHTLVSRGGALAPLIFSLGGTIVVILAIKDILELLF